MVYERVQEYINKNKISVSGFEKLCGLGNGTVSGWKKGNPSVNTLVKIEKATKVPMAKWLE